MTKREYLSQYRIKWDEIQRTKLEIEQLRTHSEEIAQAVNGMPGGGKKEGFPAIVEKIILLEQELEEQVNEAVELRLKIEAQISSIPNSKEQTVLKYHYINGYTFETIAELMNLSDRWAKHIHSAALESLERIYK